MTRSFALTVSLTVQSMVTVCFNSLNQLLGDQSERRSPSTLTALSLASSAS